MQKRYIVRLTEEEREICRDVIRRLKGSSERVRRAQVLLQADADGPGWTDREIAAAFSCRVKTVENIRQRCVLEGFDKALERKQRATPPTPKILDGESEARIIALRLGPPPKGYTPKHGSWLNIAECELSAMTRQCLNGRRLGDLKTLCSEIAAWSTDVNRRQRGVDWQMDIDDARRKLKSIYPDILM